MAAGQGIGNAIKAFAMGPQVRQQAAQSQEATLAKIYADNMQGNQYGANARKLTADATDQEMTTRLRDSVDAELAANPNLSAYERALRTGFKFAGPQHMQNWSAAAVNEKKVADLNAIQSNPALAQVTNMAYAATDGKPMFSAVGDSGVSLNQYTGEQPIANPVLAKLFGDKRVAETAKERAQANSSNASAFNSQASGKLTSEKLRFLQDKGFLPGESNGDNYNINPVLSRVLRVPVTDSKGNQMLDTDGRPMMQTDQEGMRQLFQWMQANGKTNTNAAIVEWEAMGRPKANMAPGASATPAAPTGQVQETATLDGKTYQKVNGQWYEAAAPANMPRVALPKGYTADKAVAEARAAIASGKDQNAVIQRLREMGIDPKGLEVPRSPAPVPAQAAPVKAAPAQATPAAKPAQSVASILGADTRDNALNAIMKAKANRIEGIAADAKAARDAFVFAARSGDAKAMQRYQADMDAKNKAFTDALSDMMPQQSQLVRNAVGM